MQNAILLLGPANVIIVESIRQKELEEKVFDPTKTEFRMQLLKKDGKLERWELTRARPTTGRPWVSSTPSRPWTPSSNEIERPHDILVTVQIQFF